MCKPGLCENWNGKCGSVPGTKDLQELTSWGMLNLIISYGLKLILIFFWGWEFLCSLVLLSQAIGSHQMGQLGPSLLDHFPPTPLNLDFCQDRGLKSLRLVGNQWTHLFEHVFHIGLFAEARKDNIAAKQLKDKRCLKIFSFVFASWSPHNGHHFKWNHLMQNKAQPHLEAKDRRPLDEEFFSASSQRSDGRRADQVGSQTYQLVKNVAWQFLWSNIWYAMWK